MRGAAAAAMCAVVLVGCGGGEDAATPQGPPPPTEVSHDIAGLANIFPAIGAPESVAWVEWSGSAGDGESTVRWTDAVVRLAPTVADAMIAQFEPTGTGREPMVQDILQSEVPKGPFLTGERFDAGFGSDATTTYAYLDHERATLVLQATTLEWG